MKHPFKVGDLVRSKMAPGDLAFVAETRIEGGRQKQMWVDVIWNSCGLRTDYLPVKRFILISRAEQ